MISLNSLRRQYYEAVLAIDNLEDMKSILPNAMSSNFEPILKGVIDLLSKEIYDYIELMNEEKDESGKEAYMEEIRTLKQKVDLCQMVIDSALVQQEEYIDMDKKTTIIFGVNPSGNISFFNDIKRDIDEHYYPTILELLEQLESGEITHNPEKSIRFNSNNGKLQGLFEIKGFQVRLFYRLLPSNMVYVEMVRVKKANCTARDIEEPVRRTNLLGKDYEMIRSRIKEGKSIDEIIISSQEILRDIREYLLSRTKKEVK